MSSSLSRGRTWSGGILRSSIWEVTGQNGNQGLYEDNPCGLSLPSQGANLATGSKMDEVIPTAGLIPGSRRSSGGGNGNPLEYSCLKNPMDRGARWATVHSVAKSWTWLSDWAHTHTYLSPLQSSSWKPECLPGWEQEAHISAGLCEYRLLFKWAFIRSQTLCQMPCNVISLNFSQALWAKDF